MSQLTTPELLFIEEHLRSASNLRKFTEYCSQEAQDPAIRSLCTLISGTMLRTENDFAGYLKSAVSTTQ